LLSKGPTTKYVFYNGAVKIIRMVVTDAVKCKMPVSLAV
jgi:hypothetical protein